MKMFKLSFGILVLAAICLVVFFQAPPVSGGRPASVIPDILLIPPQTAVARVNSVSITAGELEEEFSQLLPPTTAHGAADSQRKDNLRKMALEQLVARE
jgi:hypothetical protein